MKKLSTFLTAIIFVYITASVHALQCRDIKVGEYKKTLWDQSFLDGISGLAINELAKRDDIFEEFAPEIEFDLGSYIEFSFQATRSVRDHLPKPTNDIINSSDILNFKVRNNFQVELKGKVEAGILFSEGIAGIDLTHSTNRVPGKKLSECNFLKLILDDNEKSSALFHEGVCKEREKDKVTQYYETFIDFFSQHISNFMHRFIDSDKHTIFAEDPLSPLKIHALLGVPIDHNIFFENNTDISVGDVIDHTTFYAAKPLGLKFDIFEFIRPTYSRFRRFFRTIGYKKLKGNKVIVEIEDTIISGNDAEVFRISPRLFKLIKINLGKWGLENFTEESLTQKFEIDLNKEKGLKFFKEILKTSYKPNLSLNTESVLINYAPYEEAIKAYSPIFRDASGEDNLLVLKLPGIFDYQRRAYSNITSTEFEGQNYVIGEKLMRERLRSKLAIDLFLFEISRKNWNHECKVNLDKKSDKTDKNSALNVECSYYNKYGKSKHLYKIADSLDILLGDQFSDDHHNYLKDVQLSTPQRISMHSNISFPMKELDKISNKSEDEIYHTIAKLLFGQDAQNIFATKNHRQWKVGNREQFKSTQKFSKLYKKCSLFLHEFGITDKINPLYDAFAGAVGNQKGIDHYKSGRCYSYFRMARDLTKSIIQFKNKETEVDKAETFLKLFTTLDKASLAQRLLIELSDGLSKDRVRFSYAVTAKELDKAILDTNGISHNVGLKKIRASILDEIQDEFNPRIGNISYFINTCSQEKLNVKMTTHYPLSHENIHINFLLNTSTIGKEENLLKYKVPLNKTESIGENTIEFNVPISLVYDPSENYNISISLMNELDQKISKQTKSFIRKLYKEK